MGITKIEARREQLNAYSIAIDKINQAIEFELLVVQGKYEWADEEDIERAKIRCTALHNIRNIIEQEALK